MKKLAILIALFLAGCAASQEDLNTVAENEAGRLAKSSKPLSRFASYELKSMILSPEIKAKPDKVKEAAVLETKIKGKLQPLFAEWSMSKKPGRSGDAYRAARTRETKDR